MSAELKPLANTPSILKEGESVICEVKGMMESMIIVEIIHVPGKKRSISGLRSASIHISNLAEGYVEEIGKEYRMGDIIRAKVIQAKPSVRLSTVGREYGVIKSFCMRCRHPLKKKGSALECPRCGRVETRKMAIDYGEGNLDLVVK
jgi:exosome complex component CSL4